MCARIKPANSRFAPNGIVSREQSDMCSRSNNFRTSWLSHPHTRISAAQRTFTTRSDSRDSPRGVHGMLCVSMRLVFQLEECHCQRICEFLVCSSNVYGATYAWMYTQKSHTQALTFNCFIIYDWSDCVQPLPRNASAAVAVTWTQDVPASLATRNTVAQTWLRLLSAHFEAIAPHFPAQSDVE